MNKAEIINLLTRVPGEELLRQAGEALANCKGRRVYVRGLIEISNICRRNCLYCGLRAPNRELARYRLTAGQIVEAARSAVSHGADSIVLQGGEGCCEAEWLADVIRAVKAATNVPLTLSVGEAKRDIYKLWREAGADRYLLKHETASEEFYASLHPGYTLHARLRCLNDLKELGYEIGTGFMIGLPGQNEEMIAGDIMLCERLHADMVGAGPFLAHSQTPFAAEPSGDYDFSLRVLATLRIALPWANMPATTALASVEGADGQVAGLLAGANVLMPNYTPAEQAGNFRIYDQKRKVGMEDAVQAIKKAGRLFVRPCPDRVEPA